MSRKNEGNVNNGTIPIKKERSRSRSPRRRDDIYIKKEIKQEYNERGGSSKERESRSPKRREDIYIKKDIKEEYDERGGGSKEREKKVENVGLGAKNRLKSLSIQMKLNSKKPSTYVKPKLTVAAAFNQDSDSEPEEMPPEARMRMRNIGRDTPTSSGPNSFGKTKQGFSDAKKMFEKNLKDAMESALADD